MNTEKAPYFYSRPFVIAAGGLGMGIAAGRLLIGPPAYWAAVVGLLAALILHLAKIRRLPFLLLAFAIGLLRLQFAYPALPQPIQTCELTGRIAQTPVRGNASWRIVLDNAECNGYPIDGCVLLTLPDKQNKYTPDYGQTLHTTASLSLPQGARNEGGLDMRFYCFTQGISCTAFAGDGIASFKHGKTGLYGSLLSLRTHSTKLLVDMLGNDNGSLAAGVLHGDTNGIPDDILSDFRDSGLSHLLSVSGLHVSLLAGIVLYFMRRCRDGVQLSAIALFVLFYSAFTAFSAPAVRAAIMVVCLQLSGVLMRRNDPLSSLSLAFLIILIVSPFSLFSAGFQLSFSAMAGIFLLYPSLSAALSRLPRPVSEAIALSLAASASTLPATAAHFNRMPILAVFANLLVTPLAALSLVPSGIALLVHPIWPALANSIAQIAGVTLTLIRSIAFAAAQPGVLNIASPTFGAAALYFCALLIISPYCRAQLQIKRLLFGMSSALCLLLWLYPALSRPAVFATALDVPDGYAVHIHAPDKDTLVGTLQALNSSDVKEYLAYNGLTKFDIRVSETDGVEIQIGNSHLNLSRGLVQTDSTLYTLEQNGQIRFYEQNGKLHALAYAEDERYAILMEQPRRKVNLEELWTTTAFSN